MVNLTLYPQNLGLFTLNDRLWLTCCILKYFDYICLSLRAKLDIKLLTFIIHNLDVDKNNIYKSKPGNHNKSDMTLMQHFH